MKRWHTPVILAALILLVPAHLLLAHGGGALIAGPTAAGPYMVSVWLNPPQPWAGEPLHFTVGLATPEDGAPVLDAEILVTMQTALDQPPVVAPATTEQSINRLFYETDMEVPQAGQYDTLISIRGPAGSGELNLVVDVGEPSSINWLIIGLGGLVLVLAGAWWRARRTDDAPRS